MPGKLIVIEGLDGSGKSTQTELLQKKLAALSVDTKRIKLPDYDDPSSTLVRMYLGGEFGNDPSCVNVYAASSFYAVDRYASYSRHWKEDYLSGKVILADRYTSSNAVHQAVKLPQSEWDDYIKWLCDYEYEKLAVPEPDRIIYLDMPVDVSQRLMTKRYGGDEVKKDVHEANVEYLRRCAKAAAFAAEKMGWETVVCSENGEPRPIADISEEILGIVKKELGLGE